VFEPLCGFFHGLDYVSAMDAEPVSMLRIYPCAVDPVLDFDQAGAEEAPEALPQDG